MTFSYFLLSVHLLVSINRMVSALDPTAVAAFVPTPETESLLLSIPYDPVRMNCSIYNLSSTDQVTSVQWYRRWGEDGENSLTNATGQYLVIRVFYPEQHTGDYFCRVTTRAGHLCISNDLQLRPSSPKIFPVSDPVEVLENTRVELNCIVYSPPGNHIIRWIRGTMLQETTGYKPYVIQNFMEHDEGEYVCLVVDSNQMSNDDAKFEVKIVDPPTFSTAPNTQTLNKQDTLTLSCNPTSNGKTSFIWKFNGDLIIPSSRIQIVNDSIPSTLEVTGLTFSDEGNYTCEASNIAGRAVQTYPLKVQGSPEILSEGGTLEIVVLTSTILDCQHVARPPASSIVWTRDGQEISSDRVLANNSLPLNNVMQNTSGNYSCTVTSLAGNDSITYQIMVIGFPLQPTNLTHNISFQDSRSVLISWNIPPLDPQKRLDGFKLELWTNENNRKHQQEFEIQPNVSSKQFNDLFPGETYHAHLQSYNRAGTSEAVTTMFNLPVTAPKLELNIVALEGGRSLAVQWELLYDGGPDVKLFSLDVYMIKEISEMVHSVSPSLDAQEHIVTGLQPTTRYMVCVTIANGMKQASLNQSITTFAAPPSQPSLSITMVTTNRIHLSFSILEGSAPITKFLLNITVNDDAEEIQKVINRDNQEQVAVTSEGEELHVTLVVLDLQPFTRYSFEVAAVSNIGTGEFSLPTDTAKLKDGRIVYFIIVGVLGGVVLVVLSVVLTIVIMVKRSKAAQKRKRTFSINSGNSKVQMSFEFQSPPHWKSSRKGSMSSRGLQSPTGSSMRELPALLIMDVNHTSPASYGNKTSSCEKFHRTRADSLASDTYSCSVGVAEHRLSVCQSEPGIAHHRRSPVSEFSHSQLHGSTGKMVISGLNPTHFRHQLPLAEPSSYENNNTYDYLSPTEEDRQNSFGGRSPSADKHVPLLHQNSVDQRTTQLLTLPQSSAFSSSAPMINMRLSRESMLECPPHSQCMTDV